VTRRRHAAEPSFTFEHVFVEREGHLILRNASARVPAVGITAVVGPSGAGKSTLLRLCNRLDVPTTGRVRFRGDDVADLNPLQLRRRVGMVFQTPTLFAGTVRDNLAVAAPDAAEHQYVAALEATAVDPTLLDRAAISLSGGEAQRVCLARTLVTGPEVLLLDEPTSALDAKPKTAFERLAVELAAQGMPMLWVAHDFEQVERVADHVIALADAEVVYSGDPSSAWDNAAVVRMRTGGGA
jgi:putative ABC transport system ATP-binding protein